MAFLWLLNNRLVVFTILRVKYQHKIGKQNHNEKLFIFIICPKRFYCNILDPLLKFINNARQNCRFRAKESAFLRCLGFSTVIRPKNGPCTKNHKNRIAKAF